MPSEPNVNLEQMLLVARRLGELRQEMVFVGGSVLELLISDPAQPPVRHTLDVDLVVGARSWSELTRQQEKLREMGFREDPNGPICRWNIDGIAVDLMPADKKVRGYLTNRWYAAALRTAQVHTLEGLEVKVISAPCFLATKLEAFDGRGERDFTASHDLEDLWRWLTGGRNWQRKLPVASRSYGIIWAGVCAAY